MEAPVSKLVKLTVPPQLHHLVEDIFETSREYEEERLKELERKPKRFNRDATQASGETASEDLEARASHLAIARVVMKVWSSRMFRYAEHLIVSKAIQEEYIEEKHRQFVLVFDEGLETDEANDWIVEDQDELIVNLLWTIFNLKKHFEEVHAHRSFILKSYERLKSFLPELHPEIIERHDLSKFAFSQAIGYTLKFIHKTWHPIWRAACELHLNHEPHHPQAWAKKFTPEEKLQNLKNWTRVASSSSCVDCPYGMDLTTLSLEGEHMPLPFLLESYVDMVAIEWERKKGKRADLTDSELIYMDEKFLMRYINGQRRMILDLVNRVISSDKSWENVTLTDRESRLLSTVSDKEKGPVLFRIEILRRQELERQKKKIKCAVHDAVEKPAPANVTEAMMKKASDYAFYFIVSIVIMDIWESKFRKFIEHLILLRAVKEGYIRESHLKWIFFAEESEDTKTESLDTIPYDPAKYKSLVDLIWEEYNMREHFLQMKGHRYWLRRSYHRLSKFVPELPEEVIERHDLSKFAFSQAIGYTLKWVHNIDTLVWKKACDLHLNREPHHPQMWQQRHSLKHKEKCLERFLCHQASGPEHYGLHLVQLDLTSESMALMFLLESFVDMVAVEWERNKDKREDLTDTELVHMDEKYLNRYCDYDKAYIVNFMAVIQDADKPDVTS